MPSSGADAVLRYSAFSSSAAGGNPAGVVLDADELSDREMLAIAKRVDYSETAFLTARKDEERAYEVRYFSAEAEVPFCGHATVATAVALAERDGPGEIRLNAPVGPVPVITRRDDRGRLTATRVARWRVTPRRDERARLTATLTSVRPRTAELVPADLDEILAALRWER